MDTQRLIALVVFTFSGMMLWEAWNKHDHPPTPAVTPSQHAGGFSAGPDKALSPTVPIPTVARTEDKQPLASENSTQVSKPVSGRRILVETDMLSVTLDTQGGDIREVVLLKQAARGDKNHPFRLMQDKVGTYYIAQSGLLGTGLPNHVATWTVTKEKFNLDTMDVLEVPFTYRDTAGLSITKTFVFRRGSYVVDIRYDIKNERNEPTIAKAYFQFLHDGNPPEGESAGNMFSGVSTFTGPAIYTDAKKYQKVSFADIEKNKQEYVKESADGWIAMVQHYFVSAWLPDGKGDREFFTKKVGEKLYTAGVIVQIPAIAAGASAGISMPLYMGPQEQEKLKELAPGLDLVVDYGWLTVLAYPMFLVLSWINKIVANWGWTIIIFTILLKLLFFPLNQKAGKSMAHMKQLAPKVEALKARYGDDKMKMNQAMMDLYRTEKVNPLGGCLPIVIQMPFLIAMYWVLLGAVELRNAPWMGWLSDLSTPDPYYVLPVIMGASMFIQTKLNPAPPDPVQAKVMLIMPLVFSVMFFFFPAGLVLYWTMQNILGIGQQWYINKTTADIGKPRASNLKP